MKSIQYDDEHTLRAFVNKELNVITTAVYGIDAIDGGRLIYAYGKESKMCIRDSTLDICLRTVIL